VAAQPLRFGTELTGSNLREIEWPAGAVPGGAFSAVSEVIKVGERRVVLSAIEVNEPVLQSKITGPGQRASLSAVIESGMKAVTIRVNDVFGVAGFVLPGDRVDVLHTHAETVGGDGYKKSYTDVLLQHVRVLGVDQLADDRTDRPTVVKAVTLEVDTQSAQKLTLAATIGSLSLALRPAGATAKAPTQRITGGGLFGSEPETDEQSLAETGSQGGLVAVTRAVIRTEYTVPIHARRN
jgi:pilus assembly protein CpaB